MSAADTVHRVKALADPERKGDGHKEVDVLQDACNEVLIDCTREPGSQAGAGGLQSLCNQAETMGLQTQLSVPREGK